MSELGPEIDELFELEPERFVAARDELAKRLREGGDPEGAREVKSLRRPTVAAWALNHLPRRRQKDLERLLEVGRELARAQRSVLSGKRADLTGPGEERRALIARLVEAAGAFLSEAGRDSAATREAIQGGLEAASVDEEIGRTLLEGRLSKEPAAPVGFGGIEGFQVVPGGRREGRTRAAPPPDPAALRARVRELKQAARRAAKQAEGAERRAARAREVADGVRREADQAEARAADAEAKAQAADLELRRARNERDAAAAAAEDAAKELAGTRSE